MRKATPAHYEQLRALKRAAQSIHTMSAADAVKAMILMEQSNLPWMTVTASDFLRRYRASVQMVPKPDTMRQTYGYFRNAITLDALYDCFHRCGSSYMPSDTEVLETMETLVLDLVRKVIIPPEAIAEIEAEERKAETVAALEISSTIMKARAAGMSQQDLLGILQIVQGTVPTVADAIASNVLSSTEKIALQEAAAQKLKEQADAAKTMAARKISLAILQARQAGMSQHDMMCVFGIAEGLLGPSVSTSIASTLLPAAHEVTLQEHAARSTWDEARQAHAAAVREIQLAIAQARQVGMTDHEMAGIVEAANAMGVAVHRPSCQNEAEIAMPDLVPADTTME